MTASREQLDLHNADRVAAAVEIPNHLYVLVLILLNIALRVQLVGAVGRYFQDIPAAILHDFPGEGLGRRLLVLGIGRLFRLLILRIGLRKGRVPRRKRLWRWLWFLQPGPRSAASLPGRPQGTAGLVAALVQTPEAQSPKESLQSNSSFDS